MLLASTLVRLALISRLVGAGTTELLFYLHREREKPTSLIILPMLPGHGAMGVTVGFNW